METKLVNYKLPVDLIGQIEDLSEGNKTALVISLLKQAMSLRTFNDTVREFMYVAAKREIYEQSGEPSSKELRNLIDGLHI